MTQRVVFTDKHQSTDIDWTAAPKPQRPVLDINDLWVEFPVFDGRVQALNGVNLQVHAGEVVGLVGESGSGKSVTAMLAMRLLHEAQYQVKKGAIQLTEHDVFSCTEKQMQVLRGSEVAMIFQEPMTALNPTMRIGQQMIDVVLYHEKGTQRRQARVRVIELLKAMYIADAEQVFEAYPFELSGGMRQRIMVAMAFSCAPQLLIADEPTTALDVTVQKQVLNLLKEQAQRMQTALLIITHDMAVVSQYCERIYVMYAGTVVESGPTTQVIQRPAHPYTKGLLSGIPTPQTRGQNLSTIPGQPPNLQHLPAGCAFQERCSKAFSACIQRPSMYPVGPDQVAACWLYESSHVHEERP